MITDEERREVAKRLRGHDIVITSHDTLEKAMDKLMKAVYGERPFSPVCYSVRNLCGLGYALADLIDRPTCRNVGDDYMFQCSECGAKFEPVTVNGNEYGDVFYTPLKPLYCSACGAMVVEKEEDDD